MDRSQWVQRPSYVLSLISFSTTLRSGANATHVDHQEFIYLDGTSWCCNKVPGKVCGKEAKPEFLIRSCGHGLITLS